ncbi:MAG: tRNA (guanosine(46)-N7)-methyltransferase TrmB [Planctomycetota bacterium]|nr:MAG: tRNA (guanosine(46)-N7)-methyltransferase TrmB [Planctomycetota bacterium]REK45998.1 MAG: tRNA (guanosine(46)-N7)-methyltransferase TrmB [Planctomycetota bacterium]
MGRRALKKIHNDVDLSRHFVAGLDQLAAPLEVASLFDFDAPLEVEVGSGKGMFLAAAAEAVPQHNFLGIEVSGKYARFAAAKLARLEAPNARMIHGDALRLFREFLRSDSVAAVHVYFPDPWWKKRHRKRRVMNEAFVADVERVLQPGGRLHFWTDVEEYFHTTLKLLDRVSQLAGPREVVDGQIGGSAPWRTHFDRRMQLGEQPVYRAEFVHEPAAAAAKASSAADTSNAI